MTPCKEKLKSFLVNGALVSSVFIVCPPERVLANLGAPNFQLYIATMCQSSKHIVRGH